MPTASPAPATPRSTRLLRWGALVGVVTLATIVGALFRDELRSLLSASVLDSTVGISLTTDQTVYAARPGTPVQVVLRTTGVSATRQLTGTDLSISFAPAGMFTVTQVELGTAASNGMKQLNAASTPARALTFGYILQSDADPLLTLTLTPTAAFVAGSTVQATLAGKLSDGNYASSALTPATITLASAAASMPPAPCFTPATIGAFTAAPATVASGGTSTLTWTTTGARSVSITNLDTKPALQTSGSTTVTPAVTTTYALTAAPTDRNCADVTQVVAVTVGGATLQETPVTLRVPLEGRDPTSKERGTHAVSDLTVKVHAPGFPTATFMNLTTDAEGRVSFRLARLLADGTVATLNLKTKNHLQRVVRATVRNGAIAVDLADRTTYTDPAGSPLKGRTYLPAGDTEGAGSSHDNRVNSIDVSAWVSAFHKSDATSLTMDLDGNGSVGAEDLSLIIRNYNTGGDDDVADGTP